MSQITQKIADVLRSYGLYKEEERPPTESRYQEYNKVSESEKSLAHMEFLKSLSQDENSRLELIESKTSQLIAQTGLIFSLLGLFIPLLVDKVSNLNIIWKIFLLALLLLAFAFYMLTIRNALRNFRVSDFKYSRPMPQNVINFQEKELNEFYSEVVRDYIFSLNTNNLLNDIKATNLLKSYAAFKLANLITGVLVVIFCISVLFIQPSQPTVSIVGPVKVEGVDSVAKTLNWPEIKKAIATEYRWDSTKKDLAKNKINSPKVDSLMAKPKIMSESEPK